MPVHDREAEITSRVLTDVSFDLVSLHPDRSGNTIDRPMVYFRPRVWCVVELPRKN